MTNYEFATWVRGFLQLCPEIPLNRRKVQIIKNHLNLVASVEAELGEKNRLVYNALVQLQRQAPDDAAYANFKIFLHDTYFDTVES